MVTSTMSLHIAQRKLLFSTQNIHNFEKLLCQQGAVVTQESYYHSLNVNQTRGKKRERGKWRGYSEEGAGTAPPSWKNAAFGAVALSAGAAIGKFYLQKIFFEKVNNYSGGSRISQTGNPEFWAKTYFYRPPTNLREGNIFTRVYLSVHGGGVLYDRYP